MASEIDQAFAKWWQDRKITGDKWDAWAVKDMAERAFQAGWEMRSGEEPPADL